MVKDEAEVQEAIAVQEAEDSEPEGSEVSYGSDEPHESYQSDAESDQGKIIPLDFLFLTLNQSIAVEQVSYINGVWHCQCILLPTHKVTQLVARFCPCVCSCSRKLGSPFALSVPCSNTEALVWPQFSFPLNKQVLGQPWVAVLGGSRYDR